MNGFVELIQPKKRQREAVGLSGAVQVLRMESDAPVVGLDASIANFRVATDVCQECAGLKLSIL
jgi:hypothetical protein